MYVFRDSGSAVPPVVSNTSLLWSKFNQTGRPQCYAAQHSAPLTPAQQQTLTSAAARFFPAGGDSKESAVGAFVKLPLPRGRTLVSLDKQATEVLD